MLLWNWMSKTWEKFPTVFQKSKSGSLKQGVVSQNTENFVQKIISKPVSCRKDEKTTKKRDQSTRNIQSLKQKRSENFFKMLRYQEEQQWSFGKKLMMWKIKESLNFSLQMKWKCLVSCPTYFSHSPFFQNPELSLYWFLFLFLVQQTESCSKEKPQIRFWQKQIMLFDSNFLQTCLPENQQKIGLSASEIFLTLEAGMWNVKVQHVKIPNRVNIPTHWFKLAVE